MEREKMEIELPELEQMVLDKCLFSERFDTIVEEVPKEYPENVIGDAIKNLIHLKFLVPDNAQFTHSWIYDSDKMKNGTFKATALGINWLEFNSK
jgi:hypothetical protein